MARRSSTDRLVRLLALPAWVADNDGATFEEAATHFGVAPEVIRGDVETLWVSGLPGGMPEDLVDFSADAFEVGRLSLTEPLGLDRPVRLSHQEAIALLLSLRVLGRVLAGDAESAAAVQGARTALSKAVGGDAVPPATSADRGSDALGREAGSPVLRAVRRALAERRRLRLSYVSATDARSVREVDPLELMTDGTHLTLRAWCLRTGEERFFRLDRILDATRLDAPATAHRARRRRDGPGGSGGSQQTAVLTLAPGGRWLVEQVRCEDVAERADGTMTATVRGRDRAWLIGLVLSAGRHLIAVEPADLAQEAAATAGRALTRYGADPSSAGTSASG